MSGQTDRLEGYPALGSANVHVKLGSPPLVICAGGAHGARIPILRSIPPHYPPRQASNLILALERKEQLLEEENKLARELCAGVPSDLGIWVGA